jgi:hypothetical protein
MSNLPVLQVPKSRHAGPPTDSVVLAVFAPFGSDKVLSTWPRPVTAPQPPINAQAIVQSLRKVAAQGVHVCALVDLVDDFTWYIEIPARLRGKEQVVSVWKQDMSHYRSLAGFLAHVQRQHPCSEVILALEGHGAGYLPEIDGSKLTIENITRNGAFTWSKSDTRTTVKPTPPSPPLSMVSPELSMVSPELPATRMPMSTVGLAKALGLSQKLGARRPAVIHFNNCFNLSFELLHTVAPHADYATAYANYNFFTAGRAYEAVFARLRAAGGATREQVARWFAETNQIALDSQGMHPTIGGMVRLADMKGLATLVDALSVALVKAMSAADGDIARKSIRRAVVRAQQYDTVPDYRLAVPDQLTDLRHFAVELVGQAFTEPTIAPAATALAKALSDLRVYGSADHPHPRPSEFWDFKEPPLAINILLPDPALEGIWDWRSPYYLRSRADQSQPTALAEDIAFLKDGKWLDFIVKYHETTKFVALQPARAPVFPVFTRDVKPDGGDSPPPSPPEDRPPGKPGSSRPPTGQQPPTRKP